MKRLMWVIGQKSNIYKIKYMYKSKHTGNTIDEQIEKSLNGENIIENTVDYIDPLESRPISSARIYKAMADEEFIPKNILRIGNNLDDKRQKTYYGLKEYIRTIVPNITTSANDFFNIRKFQSIDDFTTVEISPNIVDLNEENNGFIDAEGFKKYINNLTEDYLEDIEKLNEKISNKVDKEPGKGLSTNDYTNEDKAQVAKNTSDIATKQDTISDLDTIRTNAQKGATALQSVPEEYITESELEAKGYVTKTEVSGVLSGKVDKVEDKGLSTEDFTTLLKHKLESLQNYDDANISAAITKLRSDFDTLVESDTSGAIDKFNEIIAFLDGIEDSQSLDSIIASIEQQIAGKQSTITDLDFIREGASKGATALQEELYKGTITEVKMNGESKGTNGIVDLGTVITSHQDISGKQDALVSGTNIKTINGESILGSGDISIDIQLYTPILYSELVELRNNNGLTPGKKYRITDYVTIANESNIKSAGHPFNIIVEALNENTLSERAKAIQDENDGYFDSEKLEAWDLWYCLDNDANRFDWGVSTVYDSSSCVINSNLIDGNAFKTPFAFSGYMWDDPINGDEYESKVENDLIYEWGFEEEPNGNKSLYLLKSDVDIYNEEGTVDTNDKFYYRGVIEADGTEYDCWQKYETNENGYNIGQGDDTRVAHFALTERIVEGNIIECQNGKGIIYRMIDEYGNDCPYDFKNIMFKRPNAEDVGDDNYYFTFSWVEEDGNVIDASIFGNNGYLLDDVDEIPGVFSNIIGKYIYNGVNKLPVNIFISDYNYEDGIYYGCHNNSLGDGCYNNSFGDNCYENSFGNNCYNNSFGDYCYRNSFGDYCYSNSFGYNCRRNSFGDYCYSNTFGDGCRNNRFGDNCYNNSFGNECNQNSLGNDCYGNEFGNECTNNSFGNDCSNNMLCNECENNSLYKHCYNNSFDKQCFNNSLGNNCGEEGTNLFGYNCHDNSFGDDCYGNTFVDNCSNNILGNGCSNNNFEGIFLRNNYMPNNCSNIIISGQTDEDNYIQNLVISKGVSNTQITIPDSLLNVDYEIKVAKNSSGELKIYCEADLIA